jgi:hypothetical protein
MADSKVTDMTAATSVNPTDVLYLIQSNTDKKISISTLLGNLPNTNTKLAGLLALGLAQPQVITNDGTINSTVTLSILSNEDGSFAVGLNNGTQVGQLKLVFCSSAAGTTTVAGANLNVTDIIFDTAGQTVLLIWFQNKWWPIGGTAAITL